MTVPRIIIATLAASALAAPAAQAQGGEMPAQAIAPPAAAVAAPAQQDLRSPDARDASRSPHPTSAAVPGQPSWPIDPATLIPPAQSPAAAADDGSSVPVIPLAAGGLLVLLAAFAAARYGRHMHRRPRLSA
jgi:hypothetical protein